MQSWSLERKKSKQTEKRNKDWKENQVQNQEENPNSKIKQHESNILSIECTDIATNSVSLRKQQIIHTVEEEAAQQEIVTPFQLIGITDINGNLLESMKGTGTGPSLVRANADFNERAQM